MGQYLLPEVKHSRLLILFPAQISHGKAELPIHDRLPGYAYVLVYDGRAQHLMLFAQPFQRAAKLVFRRQPLHFEDAHQTVGPGLRFREVLQQHSLLQRKHRIYPLHPLSPCGKVRHHGFKRFLAPLCFAKVGGGRHQPVARRQVFPDTDQL